MKSMKRLSHGILLALLVSLAGCPNTLQTVIQKDIDVKTTVADPTFSPASGGMYTIPFDSPQTIVISSTSSGASIRYTTDGSTPTSATGTLYTGSVPLYSTTTLKAIAYATNFVDSAVMTAAYTVNPRLYDTTGATGYYFGSSVCVSNDGNVMVVGAKNEKVIDTAQGAAHVFVRSGGVWVQKQILTASDGVSSDFYGTSVSCSGDGKYIVVGAPNNDEIASNNGAAYIYTKSTSGWSWGTEVKVHPTSTAALVYFGYSVACSGDGKTIVVGAYWENYNFSQAGAVYAFSAPTGDWSTAAMTKLPATSANQATGDKLGWSVACSNDGSVIVAGAYAKTGGFSNQGAVFTFSGTDWATENVLVATDPASNDWFGFSVSCSSDGKTIVAGAGQKTATLGQEGAAYVFTGSVGSWAEAQKIVASDAALNDWFGKSVSCSADGKTIVIGAYQKTSNLGEAYVYTGTNWAAEQKLNGLRTDGAASDYFGYSVSCSGDGGTIVVGAQGRDTNQGSAYVYMF